VLRELRPGDPRLIGPYQLLGRLGDGGMGQVFLGLSAGGIRVAVKVIRTELAADPEFRLRFRREVAAARMVSGLFTATVADADTDAPQPWLATAYVPGPSLAEAVREHGPLPLSSVLTLAAGLAESLTAIHGAGVVHRDLKPSNVLLSEDGPCVIDFGISRATEATSLTQTGLVMGSPGFMSPEQAEGDQVGPPSDIFSLGAVLAFAASGQPPFGSGSGTALMYRVVHSAARLDGVPDQVRPLIERCLVKDPSLRPAASDLLAEVGAIRPATGWLREPAADPLPEAPVRAAADLRGTRRPRFPRPLALGAAAASMLIAAIATWLATAGGQSHPTSGPGNKDAMRVVAPPAAFPSAQPAASRYQRSAGAAARSTHASSSGRPGTQSATADATASAAATRPATAPTSRPTRTPSFSFSFSGASEQSCAAEGSVSSSDGTPAQFAFTDNAPAEVEIASVDANGVLTPYAVLDQGGTLTVSTHVGDYWVVEKSAGSCLAVFQIDSGGHIVVG
jgi:serine/threonine protein kinase